MTNARVSVIVPVYNVAPWLGQCLDSLLAQTYQNLEIVVVNDGSTDDTGAVLADYAARYPSIVVIKQENRGVTTARLRGVAEATGDWIGFFDGDDLAEPEMFARLLENAKVHDAEISHCGFQLEYPNGRVEPHFGTGALKVQDRQTALRDLLEEKVVEPGLGNKLFRQELFQGLEDWMDTSIRHNEDMLMNFYLFSRADQAVFEDICPYRYQVRAASASRSKLSAQMVLDPLRVRKRILAECGEELRDTAAAALLRHALHGYANLAIAGDRQLNDCLRVVRREICDHPEGLGLLSTRNRLLRRMICLCPGLVWLAFRCYGLLGGKNV